MVLRDEMKRASTQPREEIMSSTEMKGPLAVLNLPSQTKALIVYAKKVLVAMTGNPHFPNPDPPLGELDDAIVVLVDAETGVGGGQAKTKHRNAARRTVILRLCRAKNYVQGIAEQQQSQADAIAVITSAAMFVKKVTKPSKAELSARYGALSGSVLLIARAAAYTAVYYWQWSLDQQTWTSVADTLTARTTINGLTAGTTCFFRFHALTRSGVTEWSQVVSLLIK
jgi:hypothetical protein